MQIVEINPQTKTYRGPYMWPDGSTLINVLMTLEDATAAGYTPEKPAKAVPEEVPAWALMAVVDGIGKRAALEAAVAALPNGIGAKFRWLFARGDSFPRDGATVDSLGAAIGLTRDQTDDLFISAKTLADSI